LADPIWWHDESNIEKGASLEGAVLGDDHSHEVGSAARHFPKNGVRARSTKVALTECRASEPNDGWALDLASEEREAIEKAVVANKIGDLDDLGFISLAVHGTVLLWNPYTAKG
jgi:hypothetical protein